MYRKASIVIIGFFLACNIVSAQYPKMDKLLFGVAYYDEYMPYDRLDKDVQMMKDAVEKAGLWGLDQQLSFPIITKSGVNQNEKKVHYYFNYSAAPVTFTYPYNDGKELLQDEAVQKNKQLQLNAWGVKIIEER